MSNEAQTRECHELYGEGDTSLCRTENKPVPDRMSDHLGVDVLAWAPTAFFWGIIPFYLFYLMSKSKQSNQHGVIPHIKVFMTFSLAVVTLVQLSRQTHDGSEQHNTHSTYSMEVARVVTLILVAVVMRLENGRGSSSSILLFLFWMMMLLPCSLSLYNAIIQEVHKKDLTSFVLTLASLCGVSVQLFLSNSGRLQGKVKDTSKPEKFVHPEDVASVTGTVFFDWVYSFVKKGYEAELEESDIPDVNSRDQCQTFYPALEHAWKMEEEKTQHWMEIHSSSADGDDSKTATPDAEHSEQEEILQGHEKTSFKERKSSLFWVLLRAYGPWYIFYQVSEVLLDLSYLSVPLLIEAIMKYLQNRAEEPEWKGLALVVMLFVATVCRNVAYEHLTLSSLRFKDHMSAALKLMLFKKALTSSNMSTMDKTSGQIVTLMGECIDEVCYWSRHTHVLLLFPLKVGIAFYLLYHHLGVATFGGLGIIIATIPFNFWIGKRMHALDEVQVDVLDKRIKIMNEILGGIKVLKMYAWEESFMRKVMKIRDEELDLGKKILITTGFEDMMFRTIPIVVCLVSFITYVALGGYLDPSTAFLASDLFGYLNRPFSQMAIVVPGLAKSSTSMKRLHDFMNCRDIPPDVVTVTPEADSAIRIEKGTFSWDSSIDRNHLKNINLDIPEGKLVAVVGMVGTGKSSLLSAILGEMEKLKGTVTVKGSVGYVAQEAWIQNETVRNNVLFGSEFESKKYHKVISACALTDDLKVLPAGDKTEIGEKGINLSGGQKQRVALARAVYNDADIYLFDDTLSAVDAHVGRHIFNKVIGHNGLLKDKTRVMVTHGIHWLPFVDNIIVLKDGCISETGTYAELISHDGAFAQFLKDVCEHKDMMDDTEEQKIREKVLLRLSSLGEGQTQQTSPVNEEEEVAHTTSNSQSARSLCSDDEDDDNDVKVNDMIHDTDVLIQGGEKTDVDAVRGKIIEEEETQTGRVSWDIYKAYGKEVGVRYVVIFSLVFVVLMLARDYKKLWLGKWTEDPLIANQTLLDTPEYKSASWFYLSIFGILGITEAVLAMIFIVVLQMRAFDAAKMLHNKLLANILRLPMSFFDTTPSARVITRFAKDISCVDQLGDCLDYAIRRVGNTCMHLLMVLYLTPWLLTVIIPITLLFLYLQQLYIMSARQLRRYASKHKSPIFEHFKETLNGTTTVRAFKAQDRFVSKMINVVESHMKFDILELIVSKWFAVKLALMTCCVTLGGGIAVLLNPDISIIKAGLALTSSAMFVDNLCRLILHWSYTEQQLVSLERIMEYTQKPTEAPWEIAETAPPVGWPQNGKIVMNDYKTRYREGLDLVLKGVTFTIHKGEKIGIVGRTGAGKSSLTLALFRLIEAAGGYIDVDGQQIARLGLHDLRKKITILPQDPMIFGDSIQMNLDPFNEKSTRELWEALEHAHLRSHVESLPDKLEYDCGESGKNLSAGQRQLLCLARTLLRKTIILVLDEATASVDMETDDLIQKTICSEFSDCTVLTIAHRLNTILDYDRVLVLDQGLVKEFDTPKNLLADPNSLFYALAKQAKIV